MAVPESWFRSLGTEEDPQELEQGDIIPIMVHISPTKAGDWPANPDANLKMALAEGLGIVATQSCDLAADTKRKGVSNVVVCRVYSLTEASAEHPNLGTQVVKESIKRGDNNSYHMLFGKVDGYLPEDFYLVALREFCSVPYSHLQNLVKEDEHRPRLRSPMREAFGSAFAEQFSRVAIDPKFEIPSFIEAKGPLEKALSMFNGLTADQKSAVIAKHKELGPFNRIKSDADFKALWEKCGGDADRLIQELIASGKG